MDRALDLKPEITQGCGFETRLWSTTEVRPLGKAPNPQLLPGRRNVGCPLLQVCVHWWVKCRAHISLLIILCIIVYVTNKAHLSLICVMIFSWHTLGPLVPIEHCLNANSLPEYCCWPCPSLYDPYVYPSSDATSSRIMHHVTKLKSSQTGFLNMTMSSLYSNGLHSHQISIQ